MVAPRSIEKAPEKRPSGSRNRLPVTVLLTDPFEERSVPLGIPPSSSMVIVPWSHSAWVADSTGMSSDADLQVPIASLCWKGGGASGLTVLALTRMTIEYSGLVESVL